MTAHAEHSPCYISYYQWEILPEAQLHFINMHMSLRMQFGSYSAFNMTVLALEFL